jgi:hypothetical protein
VNEEGEKAKGKGAEPPHSFHNSYRLFLQFGKTQIAISGISYLII